MSTKGYRNKERNYLWLKKALDHKLLEVGGIFWECIMYVPYSYVIFSGHFSPGTAREQINPVDLDLIQYSHTSINKPE